MFKYIIHSILLIITIYLYVVYVDGISINEALSIHSFAYVSIVFIIIDVILFPLMYFLLLPFRIITFGLISLFVSFGTVYLVSFLVPMFVVTSVVSAILLGFTLGCIRWILK